MGNVASFTERTKSVPRCISKMRLLGEKVAGPGGLVSDHAGPEVERDDERERLLRAPREDVLLVRDERETDVGGQPECARRDDVPEDRGQAMPDMALVRASMDEPGCCCSEDITAKHLEDRQEGGRDALEGRIVQQEPGRDACESEEQQDADQPPTARNGLA